MENNLPASNVSPEDGRSSSLGRGWPSWRLPSAAALRFGDLVALLRRPHPRRSMLMVALVFDAQPENVRRGDGLAFDVRAAVDASSAAFASFAGREKGVEAEALACPASSE